MAQRTEGAPGGRGLRWPLLLIALLALCAGPQPALAQEAEGGQDEAADETQMNEEELAAKHFQDGRMFYNDGKYKEAIEALLKAYELRPAPPILLNIARTYEKLEDKKNALKFYKEFLLKARLQDPNRPMVEKVAKELEAEVGEKTGAVTTAAGTETPDAQQTDEGDVVRITRKQQLIHTPVDAGKVRKPLTLVAELPPNVDATYLVIHYRKGGESKFRTRMMEEQGEAFIGRIPANQITSTSLQYYIEAVRKDGATMKVVATAGTKSTPNIVVIEGGRSLSLIRKERQAKAKEPSPHRKWWIISAGVAGAAAVVGGVMGGLALDRSNAVETFVKNESCSGDCTRDLVDKEKTDPTKAYDHETKSGTLRDLDTQGKTFSYVAYGMIGVAAVAAGVAGYFFYKDLTFERADPEADPSETARAPSTRFLAAPWASENGGGIVGRIDF